MKELLLLSIIRYLEGKGLVAGDGIDAFRDFAPEQPDYLLLLTEYSGSSVSYDTSVERRVQVLVRDRDADNARKNCNDVYKQFNPVSDSNFFNLTKSRWAQIFRMQPPFKIRTDSQGRVYYGFNLRLITESD